MHVGHTDMVAPGVPVPHPPHCQSADVAVLQLGMAHQVSSEVKGSMNISILVLCDSHLYLPPSISSPEARTTSPHVQEVWLGEGSLQTSASSLTSPPSRPMTPEDCLTTWGGPDTFTLTASLLASCLSPWSTLVARQW